MAWVPPSPRCGQPVEFRDTGEPRDDLFPVCWRPAPHVARDEAAGRPVRHLSRYAYLNELKRGRRHRREFPYYRRAA